MRNETNRPRTWRAALAVLAAGLILGGTAFAQTTTDPFFDHTLRQSQAWGVEMVRGRLAVVGAIEAPLDEDLVEETEKAPERDLLRFVGSLAAANPQLAEDLEAALDAVIDMIDDGEFDAAVLDRANSLLDRAEATLFDAATRLSPDYVGAVMANLLLGDDGVAEAYEDVVEEDEPWGYPIGWATLQRTKALWQEVRVNASPEAFANVEEMFAQLDELYPTATPPAEMSSNPEEAEDPAERLVGLLEEVTGAALYAGRDLPRLAGHLATVTVGACSAFDGGDLAIATETMLAVRDPYRDNLRKLLDLFEPDLQAELTDSIEVLAGRKAPLPEDAGDLCRTVVEQLNQTQSVLGG